MRGTRVPRQRSRSDRFRTLSAPTFRIADHPAILPILAGASLCLPARWSLRESSARERRWGTHFNFQLASGKAGAVHFQAWTPSFLFRSPGTLSDPHALLRIHQSSRLPAAGRLRFHKTWAESHERKHDGSVERHAGCDLMRMWARSAHRNRTFSIWLRRRSPARLASCSRIRESKCSLPVMKSVN